MAEMLHHRVRVDAAQRIRHALALVLPFAFKLVLAFQLVLVLPLVFEFALAEQAADDAAEVELLALVFALQFVLELGERTVVHRAGTHDVCPLWPGAGVSRRYRSDGAAYRAR